MSTLEHLGKVLHGHTWRHSGEWARALAELAALGEGELELLIRLAIPITVPRAEKCSRGEHEDAA